MAVMAFCCRPSSTGQTSNESAAGADIRGLCAAAVPANSQSRNTPRSNALLKGIRGWVGHFTCRMIEVCWLIARCLMVILIRVPTQAKGICFEQSGHDLLDWRMARDDLFAVAA